MLILGAVMVTRGPWLVRCVNGRTSGKEKAFLAFAPPPGGPRTNLQQWPNSCGAGGAKYKNPHTSASAGEHFFSSPTCFFPGQAELSRYNADLVSIDVCRKNETVVKPRCTRGLIRPPPNKFEGATLSSFNNAKLNSFHIRILYL